MNECTLTPNGDCHELRECINTAGSFECGPCKDGYVDDGATGCMFADPCAAGVHNCEKTEYCINHKLGEFYCEVRRERERKRERQRDTTACKKQGYIKPWCLYSPDEESF